MTVRSGDGRRGSGGRCAVGQPLGDQALVLLAALGGAVAAEVVVLAGEGDDGLAGGLVEAVGGDACGHGAAP